MPLSTPLLATYNAAARASPAVSSSTKEKLSSNQTRPRLIALIAPSYTDPSDPQNLSPPRNVMEKFAAQRIAAHPRRPPEADSTRETVDAAAGCMLATRYGRLTSAAAMPCSPHVE